MHVLLICVAPPVSQLFSVCIAILCSVLLLAGNTRPQPLSVALLFAVAAAVLSVGSVACMCRPSSATACLSTVCCRRSFPLLRSCCFHVLSVPSHRPSLMENHAVTVSLGVDGRGRQRQRHRRTSVAGTRRIAQSQSADKHGKEACWVGRDG